MKRQLFHVAIAAAIVCVVLAPALIWSGQKPSAAGEDLNFYKLPPVFTVGPPMTAEELATREMEKRLSFPEAEAWAEAYAIEVDRPRVHPSNAPSRTEALGSMDHRSIDHPGLTPAELEKLVAIRSGALQFRDDRSTWPHKTDFKPEKPDLPLRPPGPEGLTPEEKAKLEASRARQDKANRDEGGRSR
jgi:hypothetical protein